MLDLTPDEWTGKRFGRYEVVCRLAVGGSAEIFLGAARTGPFVGLSLVLKRMLADLRIDKFVIVTSPLHMRRSLAAFAAQGLHPVPSAAALQPDESVTPFPLLPTNAFLEIGNAVVYEWSALAYYWWRGWL